MQRHIQIFRVFFALAVLLCLFVGCASADADAPQTENGAFVITARRRDIASEPVATSAPVADDPAFLAKLAAAASTEVAASAETAETAEVTAPTETAAETTALSTRAAPAADADYVCNKNSKKFHLPTCNSVGDIKPANRVDYHGTREELLAKGYAPCKRCMP